MGNNWSYFQVNIYDRFTVPLLECTLLL